MNREESAARAVAKDEDASNWDEEQTWYQDGWLGRVDTILSAADAHDAANGVHRVTLDDATVERVARILEPALFRSTHEQSLFARRQVMDKARAVLLAAAVKNGQ